MTMKIKGLPLSLNYYMKTRDGKEYSWDTPTLIQHAKEEKLKPFDLPLDGINFNISAWDTNNMWDYIHHAKRIQSVDTKHPIILDEEGTICDGWHRVVRAVLDGKKTIKAVRLNEMPSASSIEKL